MVTFLLALARRRTLNDQREWNHHRNGVAVDASAPFIFAFHRKQLIADEVFTGAFSRGFFMACHSESHFELIGIWNQEIKSYSRL